MKGRHQQGVSLIELMVALLVGSLLLIGLVQVFSASRAAYQLSTGLARTQENGRFAMDMLQRDLRVAGHFGCVNDQARFLPGNVTPSRPALMSTFMTAEQQVAGNYAAVTQPALRFDVPIMGYNATGTSPGGALNLPAVPSVAIAGTAWQPAIPAEIFALMSKPVAGSDVLVLRHFNPAGAQIESVTPGGATVVDFVDAHAGRLTEGVSSPSLFGIADCMTAAVFGVSGADLSEGALTVATGGGNVRGLAEQSFVDGQAMLYRADSLVYYVGVNEQGNPSLYRLRHVLSGGAIVPNNEELVEGIDSLQLVFGQDSNVDAASVPTGNIGTSVSAEAIGEDDNAWRRVGLVQLGVVARSIDPAAAEQRSVSDDVPPLSLLGLRINPPADAYYRATYEDAVALRNRLFGN